MSSASDPNEAGVPTTSEDRAKWVVPGWIAVGFVVAVAAVRMAGVVISGSDIQHADYWVMIEKFTTPGGGLDVGGLFEFQNHPVVVPQLIYWLNIELFAGSNRALGIFVGLLVLATVGVVALIARSGELRPVEQMGIVGLAGVLLFSLNGAWNFALAMSGTAWLLANLLVVSAVYLRATGRLVPALALAVVATTTYGTGIMVWPALMVVGVVLRPPREWWKEAYHPVAFLATFAWYRTGVAPLASEGTAGASEYLDQTVRIFGYPLSNSSGWFDLLGWAPTIGIPVMVLWAVLARKTSAVAAWCGLGVFGWCAIVQVTAGRGGRYLAVFGDQFRYTSLGALGWVALTALVLVAAKQVTARWRDRGAAWAGSPASPFVPVAIIVVPLLIIGLLGGSGQVAAMEERAAAAELTGIAWRLDLGEDASWLVGLIRVGPVTERLEVMGHHPFVDGWDGLCGAMDETFDVAEAERVEGAGEVVTIQRRFFFDGHPMFDGWVDPDLGAECIVVVGSDGRVVGGGLPAAWDLKGPEYTPDREIFRGIHAHEAEPVTVLAVLGDGTTVMIEDELSTPEGANG